MKYRRFTIIIFSLFLVLTACQGNQPEESGGQQTNYAAGSLGYPVLLNGVGIQVDQAGILAVQDLVNIDYVHVVLYLTVSNQSEFDVVPPTMMLVDGHGNMYPAWQTVLPYEDQIVRLPLSVPTGESGIGNLVFIVPKTAVSDDLRLRWESTVHQSRMDIYLGAIGQRAQ